jgi:hypothetical protein
MTEFIINDDELCETKMLLEDMLGGEDHIDRLLEIVNTVCSHPYNPQSERDKVLDILEGKRLEYEQRLKRLTLCFDEYGRGLIDGKECFVDILKEWIEELRQTGEPSIHIEFQNTTDIQASGGGGGCCNYEEYIKSIRQAGEPLILSQQSEVCDHFDPCHKLHGIWNYNCCHEVGIKERNCPYDTRSHLYQSELDKMLDADTPRSDVLQDLFNRLTAKTERCKQLEQEHQNFCFYIKKVAELEAELKAKREKVLEEAIDRMDMLDFLRDPTVGAVVPLAEVFKVLEELKKKDGE